MIEKMFMVNTSFHLYRVNKLDLETRKAWRRRQIDGPTKGSDRKGSFKRDNSLDVFLPSELILKAN